MTAWRFHTKLDPTDDTTSVKWEPVFICDLCHGSIENLEDANLFSIDEFPTEGVFGWMAHKGECDRMLHAIMPYHEGWVFLEDAAQGTFKKECLKSQSNLSSTVPQSLTKVAGRINDLRTLMRKKCPTRWRARLDDRLNATPPDAKISFALIKQWGAEEKVPPASLSRWINESIMAHRLVRMSYGAYRLGDTSLHGRFSTA